MGVRAAPTMAMGSFCKMSLLGVVDARRRALVPSVAPLSLQTRRRRDPACLLALGRDSCGGLAAIASRPADKVSIAIGADAVERVGAGGAESTFVAADECTILVGRKRPRASLASLAHFESHIVPIRPWSSQPLLRLVEQLAADQHPSDLGRAGTDLVQLGIAPQAPGRVFVNVAVAAERLNRLTRHPRRLLGCVEYRTRGVLARHLAAIGS